MSAGATSLSNTAVGGSPELSWLKLLSNPEELAKRIHDYETAKSNADAAVALVGAAEDIPRLRAEAEKLVADAKAEAEGLKARAAEAADNLSQSVAADKAEAAGILATAKAHAQKMFDEATAHHVAAANAKTDAEVYLAAAKSQASDIVAAAAKKFEEAAALGAYADAAAAEHEAAVVKYNSKLEKLRAATAD